MQAQLYPHIIADADILAGKPVIEGTNVPVSSLVAAAAGKSMAQIAHAFSIAVTDVRAALEYAAQRVDEELPLDDPLFSLAGIFASNNPGWVDRHDEYLAEEYANDHADEQ